METCDNRSRAGESFFHFDEGLERSVKIKTNIVQGKKCNSKTRKLLFRSCFKLGATKLLEFRMCLLLLAGEKSSRTYIQKGSQSESSPDPKDHFESSHQ